MQRKSVNSSNLSSVGYDEGTQVLEIEFHGGGIYRYSGVPKDEYENMMATKSPGQYFRARIEHKHPYTSNRRVHRDFSGKKKPGKSGFKRFGGRR